VLPSLKRLPSSPEDDDTPAKVPLTYFCPVSGLRGFRDSGSAALRFCFSRRRL
jgi:hypothetical protein